MMKQKRVAVVTYGCQMNDYDSERIGGLLEKNNYVITHDTDQADIILINTCSVREKAEHKVKSHLGRLRDLKRKNRDLIIGVGGCVAQLQGEALVERSPGIVDIVFGTATIPKLPELIREALDTRQPVVSVSMPDISDADADDFEYIRRESGVTAWVSIMRGCDNACSYCVVPFSRGPEVSRKPDSIIAELRQLAAKGRREVTLLGQNVNSYNGGDGVDFPALLGLAASVDGLERIRFITSHPKDFSRKLAEQMAANRKICNYLHLPLQSGSERILKLMNRHYTPAEYLEKIGMVRGLIPDLAVATDIIVGFPGETEEDFNGTYRMMEEVGFDGAFIFNYSPRPETPASKLPDQLPREIKQARFDRLLDLQRRVTREKSSRLAGATAEVLVEGPSPAGDGKFTGRTTTNKTVHFTGKKVMTGGLIRVIIESSNGNALQGKAVEN